MSANSSNLVSIGRITAVYGVKGWVKIHSYTDDPGAVFSYTPWVLKTAHGVKPVEIDEARPHGKGFVAHIKGVDERDVAATYTGVDIAVSRDQLPVLAEGEYYWSQLEGLVVISLYENQSVRLGRVSKILETGANDVLVVVPDEASIDQRERLIPYLPGQFVLAVDLAASEMRVDWDPEF
jgi:16S rRNA processing protein RimM